MADKEMEVTAAPKGQPGRGPDAILLLGRQVSFADGLLAALEMPAVYGAAVCALVGLWVLPRRSGHLRST